MTRIAVLSILCAFFATPILASPEEDRERALANAIAVQTALVQGRDALQARNYRTAVNVLESQITHIDGNRDYLEALRNAYKSYIMELRQAKREMDAQTYFNRLVIIDPAAAGDSRLAPVTNPATATLPVNQPRPAVVQQPTPAAPAKTTVATTEDPRPARNPQVTIARGAMGPDPFSYDNSTQKQAKSLLQRAEEAFFGERYDEAGKLYEQANQVDRNTVIPSREQWAYCKYKAVVEQLNRASSSLPSFGDLEREVQQAMSLAPRMDKFGNELLHTIQDRRSGAAAPTASSIKVTHQTGDTGWSLAETTNFRIYHKMNRDMAEQAARSAERTRTEMARKWFGETEPEWNPKCDITIYASADEFARATGADRSIQGYSRTDSESGRVISRRLFLHSDNPKMIAAILPHETTHVVLAGRLGDLPHWADEGMAVLTEPRQEINWHLQNLVRHRQDNELFSFRELMQMQNYPQPRLVGAFYAQSVSLVEFLVNQKGSREFTEFMRDGMRGGYEPALRKHYNFQGFSDLEQRWAHSALQDQSVPTSVAERSRQGQ